MNRRRLTPPDDDAPQEQQEAPPPRLRRRKRRSPLRLLLWGTVLLGGLLLAPPLIVQAAFGTAILPGVAVQGLPLQRMEPAAAHAVLATRYGAFAERPLTLSFGEQRWHPTLAEIGATLDLDAAVTRAAAIGRSNNPLVVLRDAWQLATGGVDLAPPLRVDQARLQAYLGTTAAATVQQPPRNGALSLAAGKIAPTPSQIGRQVLADETARDALAALQTLEPQSIALRTRVLDPVVGDEGLAAGTAQAAQLLAGPLTLRQGERAWTWDVEKTAELLRVAPAGRKLAVTIDSARLAESVERLAQLVDTGSVEPRLQLGEGGLEVIREGRTGVALRQQEAATLIAEALRSGQRELGLPVDELRPQVDATSLATLGITSLIGEGKTSFVGSAPYRITNINAGAALLHGVLIAPGEEFSFNKAIGEINAENGFVEGYAIIGNRTQLEWGGGICQDSTTVFRAAFWAGLPLTERHAHAFRISWYEAFDPIGMDATIFTGVQDLKFVNDTGNWLLMQVSVDEANQVFTVGLYGTPTGREVRRDGPLISNEVPAPTESVYIEDPSKPAGSIEQTDTSRGGMDILISRVIVVNGVEQAPETFFTRFKAWPNVFVRGTG